MSRNNTKKYKNTTAAFCLIFHGQSALFIYFINSLILFIDMVLYPEGDIVKNDLFVTVLLMKAFRDLAFTKVAVVCLICCFDLNLILLLTT
jgi:hypothetical protein